MKADLADGHVSCLLQIGPSGVDDVDVVHLVPLNGVGFDQLTAVLNHGFRYVVDRLAWKK